MLTPQRLHNNLPQYWLLAKEQQLYSVSMWLRCMFNGSFVYTGKSYFVKNLTISFKSCLLNNHSSRFVESLYTFTHSDVIWANLIFIECNTVMPASCQSRKSLCISSIINKRVARQLESQQLCRIEVLLIWFWVTNSHHAFVKHTSASKKLQQELWMN